VKASTGAVRAIAGFVAALALFAFTPAFAQAIDPVTPEKIAAILEAQGFEANIVQPEGGNPGITSHTGKLGFAVLFDACRQDGTNCGIMVFSAKYKFAKDEDRPSQKDLNRWNLKEFGKAVADPEGDPWLDLEINTVGGISTRNFTDTLKWWTSLTRKFSDHIGWESLD
jgi:hypothetical protein